MVLKVKHQKIVNIYQIVFWRLIDIFALQILILFIISVYLIYFWKTVYELYLEYNRINFFQELNDIFYYKSIFVKASYVLNNLH